MKRLIIFTVAMLAVWSWQIWWLNNRQPEVSTTLALRQFDNTNSSAANLRQFEAGKDAVHMIALAISVLAACLCFGSHEGQERRFKWCIGRFCEGHRVEAGLCSCLQVSWIDPFQHW